jgi:hypothetical protein
MNRDIVDAEKQLRESGEADIFPELSDYVFNRAGGIEMVTQPTMSRSSPFSGATRL